MNLPRPLWKLLYHLHYGVLYGRGLPGEDRIESIVRAGERRSGRGDAPQPAASWDAQYAAGRWEFLHGTDELARFGVLTAYLQQLCPPGGSVLDVGCGEGILAAHLRPLALGSYLGIDVSANAVHAASRRLGDPQTAFQIADAERWRPATAFDAIVFNECVYYFEAPLPVVRAYHQRLAHGGVLIVSAFQSRRGRAVTRAIERALPPVDAVELHHRKGTWRIVVIPSASPAPRAQDDRDPTWPGGMPPGNEPLG